MQQFFASLLSSLLCFFGQCTAPSQPSIKHNLTIGLSWIHEAQYAGLYAADQKGYFAQEGINVTFVPYNNEDLAQAVVEGTYDIVLLQTDTLLLAREKNIPVKALFANYRIIPTVYFSKASANITRPKDLIGKTVGVAYSERYPLITMLKNAGIDSSKVNIVEREYSYEPLAQGVYDVEAGWITDGDAVRKAVGEYNEIKPYDYGVNWYADIITVSETTLLQQPEMVESFLRATIKGWQYAIENPEESALFTQVYDPATKADHLKFVLNVSIPHIHTGDGKFGIMDQMTFQRTQSMLIEQGIMQSAVDIPSIFTLTPLDNAYGSLQRKP